MINQMMNVDGVYAHAHNQFLQIAASNGIPALCIFLIWLFIMGKDMYKLYFKLGYDSDYKIFRYDEAVAEKHFGNDNKMIDYHCEFFRGGITMIIKYWLERDCAEAPEEMYQIILDEYKGRI